MAELSADPKPSPFKSPIAPLIVFPAVLTTSEYDAKPDAAKTRLMQPFGSVRGAGG